jgi:hypothetical protein
MDSPSIWRSADLTPADDRRHGREWAARQVGELVAGFSTPR